MKTKVLITVIGFYIGMIFPVKADYITNVVVETYNEKTQQVETKTNCYKISYVTNLVESSYLRIVNGQLCDTEHDIRWKNFQGKCVAVSNDKITVATFRTLGVYVPVTSYEAAGSVTHASHGAAWVQPVTAPKVTQVQTGKKEINGPIIFLKNEGYSPAIDETFSFRAKLIGTAADGDGSGALQLWECGKPYITPVVQVVKTKI